MDSNHAEGRRQGPFTGERYLGILAIVLVVAIAVFAVIFRSELNDLASIGYFGAFLISLLASATIIVPIPGLAVVFALGGVMYYPWLVGIMVGLAEPIGELTGYMAGRGGKVVIKGRLRRFYEISERLMKRRGGLFLFLFSSFPNPVFDAAGVAAGATHYPVKKFLLYLWAGKTVKGMGIAYLGAWGLGFILRWFGISI